MRWEDVDFRWRKIIIRDKAEGERTIPLTPYVAGLLPVGSHHALPPRREEKLDTIAGLGRRPFFRWRAYPHGAETRRPDGRRWHCDFADAHVWADAVQRLIGAEAVQRYTLGQIRAFMGAIDRREKAALAQAAIAARYAEHTAGTEFERFVEGLRSD